LASRCQVTFPKVKLVVLLSSAADGTAASAAVARWLWARGAARRTVTPMRHRAHEVATRAFRAFRAFRAVRAVVLALAVGAALAGCATAAATGTPANGTPANGASATATRSVADRTAAPVYGPPALDAACVAAKNAEKTLESHQGKDQNNESALDQDFTNFASALSAAAQREKRPAAAQAMTALANDYTDLVQSQSGAAQLPDMTQVQNDGTAFDKACSP
jgi:uncharacterized protein YceK